MGKRSGMLSARRRLLPLSSMFLIYVWFLSCLNGERPARAYEIGGGGRLMRHQGRARDLHASIAYKNFRALPAASSGYECDLRSQGFKPLKLSHFYDECSCRHLTKGLTSQSEEDKAVHNRYFCGKTNGVFVEMGALDGVRYSNTKMFEEVPLNWRGLLIEANPRNADKIPQNRPLASLAAEAACPEGMGTVKFVGDGPVGGVVSTMGDNHREKFVKATDQVIEVPCRPLGSILRSHGIAFVDFFSLDVEGAELLVLQTMDWSIPVRVWVIEFAWENKDTNLKIVELMANNGYECSGYFCEGGRPKGWDIMKECIPGRDCSRNVVFENKRYVLPQP